MGEIPRKALRESQLQQKTAGSVINDGSHQTCKVSFIEGGRLVEGFYKKLAPKNDYPALLAKMSVATSLFKRIFQGKRSAEERLVFDDNDQLVGTLSIGVEGFRPFNFSNEPVPADSNTRELVIPSTKTLIDRNFMEILLARWFLDDDDGHPHNMSLAGDIDFDMFWYWFTIFMKKERPFIGIPKTRVDLTTDDWERFPNVRDSKTFHSPSYQYPGQETIPSVLPAAIQGEILRRTLPKPYADPTQFADLARQSLAKEQQFAAALKILLTFQPEMVRSRLEELFGSMSLDYTSLDEVDTRLRERYEKTFPQFCNAQTNKEPFIDFMMNLYQQHFDNLYRVVVLYMGCENNGFGLPLPSTCNNLYHRPSFYRNIVDWVKVQNETVHKNDRPALKYDLTELQKRYHQVWRDAFAPNLKDLLHSTYNLTTKVLMHVSSETDVKALIGKPSNDATLTDAWELFGNLPELTSEKITPLITVDQKSDFRVALLLLIDFTNKFNTITKTYYQKKRVDLTEHDNLVFCDALNELYTTYNLKIRRSLLNETSFAQEFNRIALGLKQYAEQANFQLHLTTTDEQMKETLTAISSAEILPHTHEEVMRKFNKELFLWARGLKPELFNKYVIDIIDGKYVTYLSNRKREKPVKEFLKSNTDTCDVKLAYIFCSGSEETGSLNRLLVEHLTPLMLQTQNLPSVRQAVKDESFNTAANIEAYTKSVAAYARSDSRLVNLYHQDGIRLFYEAMYQWVDKIPKAKFNGLKESALKEYEKPLWFGSRRNEVQGYNFPNQQKILAFIFLKGDDTSTLNRVLFGKIIEDMKKDLSEGKKELSPGERLIMQFNSKEHAEYYLRYIREYARGPSNIQDPVPKPDPVPTLESMQM